MILIKQRQKEKLFIIYVDDKSFFIHSYGDIYDISGTHIIAKQNGNVIKLEHNQFVSINRNAAVELRITLEAFGTEHKEAIIKKLEEEGYKPRVVRTNI